MNMIICRHSIQLSFAITVHVEATQHAFVQVDKARQTFSFKDSSEAFGHNTHSIPEELMLRSGEHLAAAAPLVTGRPVLASLTGIMLCAFLVAALLPLPVVALPLC